MSEVKRYGWGWVALSPNNFGPWVKHEDYAALEQENAQYRALMELACEDLIFFHSPDSAFTRPAEGAALEPGQPVHFSVLVNDLFVPAADAEGFDISEAIPLRDVFRKDGYEGVVRWVQAKRDGMPLRPHVEKRISEGEAARSQTEGK
jgi:hypothetical protein